MRKLKITVLSSLCFIYMAAATAAPQSYTLDPHHTFAEWHIDHFGFSQPSGKWYANGNVMFDKDKPANSQVDVNINVADVATGLPELDKHLKGKLFFNVDQFPNASFVSKQIKMTSKNTAEMIGDLTIHGVTKPVTLKVTINKVAVNPINNKDTAGFSAETKIKRSDFGITALIPGLGDDVTLNIQAEATKATDANNTGN